MEKWHIFTNKPPDSDETVLCLLSNGQQVTLAFDDSKCEWPLYEDRRLEDAIVIAWKQLESKEEIMALLKKQKMEECK